VGDQDAVLDAVERFLTGDRATRALDRVLTTILFTDIVGSTEQLAALGDRRWTRLLEQHHVIVRRRIEGFRGEEVETAGDGFLATFAGPGRAVRAAMAIGDDLAPLGLRIRAGIHTGECELIGGTIAGIAVHLAARIAADADPGEVLVSSTVRSLVAGSGLEFSARGTRTFKGVPEPWDVFAVVPSRPVAAS
jgi:class 3 adenylate cyclase